MRRSTIALIAGLTTAAGAGAPGVGLAHVTVSPDSAVAGGYQVLRFGVGHGCDGQATTELRIELPPGVQAARPQAKPGWRERVEGPPEHPTAVVWAGGRLPADRFDEFLILLKAPDAAGRVVLPAIQRCGAQESRWSDPPGPDGQRSPRPAPVLRLTPPEPQPEHHH